MIESRAWNESLSASDSPERHFLIVILLQCLLDGFQISRGNAGYFVTSGLNKGRRRRKSNSEILLTEENYLRIWVASSECVYYCDLVNIDHEKFAGFIALLLSGDVTDQFEQRVNAILEESEFGRRRRPRICNDEVNAHRRRPGPKSFLRLSLT